LYQKIIVSLFVHGKYEFAVYTFSNLPVKVPQQILVAAPVLRAWKFSSPFVHSDHILKAGALAAKKVVSEAHDALTSSNAAAQAIVGRRFDFG
jgi:hypothetical protein